MSIRGISFSTISQIIAVIAIASVFSTKVLGGEIRGWIDEPENGGIYTGIATIRGWAVSTVGVKRIEMYYDGEYRTTIPGGGSRKDIGNALPGFPDSDKSGFSMAFGYSNKNGPHTVKIKIIDNDDDVKEISSSFESTGFETGFIKEASDINFGTVTDHVINNGNSFTLKNVDFRGEKKDIKFDWQNPKQNVAITRITTSNDGAGNGGDNGGGADGVYGSLTITGSSLAPSSFTPVSESLGGGRAVSDGLVQALWSNADPFDNWGLSAYIADNYLGLSGSEIDFVQPAGPRFTCKSGFLGSSGDCSGATFDIVKRTVTFSSVQLVGPGGATIILNGTLTY